MTSIIKQQTTTELDYDDNLRYYLDNNIPEYKFCVGNLVRFRDDWTKFLKLDNYWLKIKRGEPQRIYANKDDIFIISERQPFSRLERTFVNVSSVELLPELICKKRICTFNLCKIDDPSIFFLYVDFLCLLKLNEC